MTNSVGGSSGSQFDRTSFMTSAVVKQRADGVDGAQSRINTVDKQTKIAASDKKIDKSEYMKIAAAAIGVDPGKVSMKDGQLSVPEQLKGLEGQLDKVFGNNFELDPAATDAALPQLQKMLNTFVKQQNMSSELSLASSSSGGTTLTIGKKSVVSENPTSIPSSLPRNANGATTVGSLSAADLMKIPPADFGKAELGKSKALKTLMASGPEGVAKAKEFVAAMDPATLIDYLKTEQRNPGITDKSILPLFKPALEDQLLKIPPEGINKLGLHKMFALNTLAQLENPKATQQIKATVSLMSSGALEFQQNNSNFDPKVRAAMTEALPGKKEAEFKAKVEGLTKMTPQEFGCQQGGQVDGLKTLVAAGKPELAQKFAEAMDPKKLIDCLNSYDRGHLNISEDVADVMRAGLKESLLKMPPDDFKQLGISQVSAWNTLDNAGEEGTAKLDTIFKEMEPNKLCDLIESYDRGHLNISEDVATSMREGLKDQLLKMSPDDFQKLGFNEMTALNTLGEMGEKGAAKLNEFVATMDKKQLEFQQTNPHYSEAVRHAMTEALKLKIS